MRLVNNQMYDQEEFKREEDDEDEMEEGADKLDRKKDGSQAVKGNDDEDDEAEGGHANIYKSRRTFVNFLDESRAVNQGSMTCFKWSGVILILSMGIIGLLDYILTQQQFANIQYAYVMMQ